MTFLRFGWRIGWQAALMSSIFVHGPTTLLSAQAPTATGPVRVYLKPPVEAGGLVIGDDVRDRVDSTADLRKGLERYPKVLELVDDPARAQLTIEVLRRSTPETGDIQSSTYPGVAATKDTGFSVTAVVTTADGKRGEMTETNKSQFGSWKSTARLLASTIQDWIKDNRNKLPVSSPQMRSQNQN